MIELAARPLKELRDLVNGDEVKCLESGPYFGQVGVIENHVVGSGFWLRFSDGCHGVAIYKYAEVV